MTASGTTFIGYDRDGDKVFRLPNGNLLSNIGDSEEEADQIYRLGLHEGIPRASYEESWGPVTKEVP